MVSIEEQMMMMMMNVTGQEGELVSMMRMLNCKNVSSDEVEQLVSLVTMLKCGKAPYDIEERLFSVVGKINKMNFTDPEQMKYIHEVMKMSEEEMVKFEAEQVAKRQEEERVMRYKAALKREQVHKVLYAIENGIVGKYDEIMVNEELSEEHKSYLMTNYVLGFCCLDMSDQLRYVRWAVDVDANEGKLLHENYNTFGYLHIETLLLNVLKAVEEARVALWKEENA
jgi:hypothetical protein